MKKDEILDAVGGIDPKYIETAAEEVPARKKSWLRAALPVAAVLAAVLSLVLIRDREKNPMPSWQPERVWIYEDGSTPEQRLLAAIMPDNETKIGFSVGLFSYYVPVENRIAVYEEVWVGPANIPTATTFYDRSTEILMPFVGEGYTATKEVRWEEIVIKAQTWYRIKDMKELKYLISRDEEGTLRLWKFSYFDVLSEEEKESEEQYKEFVHKLYGFTEADDFSPYTCAEVYQMIYGVNRAEDIVSVTASGPNDRTGAKDTVEYKIQEEIDSLTITDRALLQQFYDCTKDAEFQSHGTWWMYMGQMPDRFTYSFSSAESTDPHMANDPLSSAPAIWASRYLTVLLKSGTTIGDWKYQAIKGVLYQYGGIVSDPLPEEDVMTLNGLFGIE